MQSLLDVGYKHTTFESDNKVVEVPAAASEPKQGESGEGNAREQSSGVLACSVFLKIHGLKLDDKGFELRRRGQAGNHGLA